ncbi:MAG TPA: lytic murein transglycosylase [Solirubrobacterales bacterium]|jgi:membrane-bound lytic murein transglycosylase B|nr:lytic murein transglycosylase [Solirubrobacterales bacterium]
MGRLRDTLAAAAIFAVLAAPVASAAEAPSSSTPTTGTPPAPASTTTTPAPVVQGSTLEAPPAVAKPSKPAGSGGTSAGSGKKGAKTKASAPVAKPAPSAAPAPGPSPAQTLTIPSVPSSTCAAAGVPPILVPIYERAAAAYGLGPQGPAVLAGINEVETAFGTNLNVSSAGAVGWMQFMPSTWETYGVDANGDGVKNPYNPEDAIFAAARYLSAAGMPSNTYDAILAYNHADWYVAEVLANANCYAPVFGSASTGLSAAPPKLQMLSCRPAAAHRREVPAQYLSAFEDAAARYGLGRRGVWALAAIARLESNFGRGMDRRELNRAGPLGLEPNEWKQYAVDGNGDGRIRHSNPADSAATLARLIWSRGSLRAGVFAHNQAEWYVQAVLGEANRMQGRCKVTYTDWSIALPAAAGSYVNPFGLSSNLVTGRVDQGVDFTGSGPIVAIGDAKILSVGAPGWPEGGGVLYQLLGGPLKGQVVFVYEGVDATVQAGQTVKAGQQIATFRPGGSIEIGFADAAGVPLSHTEYYEGKVTAYGLQMLSLLQAIGV